MAVKYTDIRARLVRRGTSLAGWAKARGYPPMTVYGAARGERAGKRAKQIRKELEELIYGRAA